MATSSFTVEYTQVGIDILNVGYVIHDSTDQTSLGNIAAAIAIGWRDEIMPSLSQNLVMGAVELLALDSPASATAVNGVGTTGGSSSLAVPVNNALVITRSDSSSRRVGRWFIPGVAESIVDGGDSIDDAYRNGMVAKFQALDTAVQLVDNARLANRHKVGVDGNDDPIYAYAAVESWNSLRRVGSQSRRRS